jgi:hypothetical protein
LEGDLAGKNVHGQRLFLENVFNGEERFCDA